MSVPWPLTGLDVGFGLLHCLASAAGLISARVVLDKREFRY